jgi:hypothetical protein
MAAHCASQKVTVPVFPVTSAMLFIKRLSAAAPAASATSTTSLSKRRSFRLGSRFAHHCFAALVEEMWGLLESYGVMVVSSCKVVLQIHFEIAMLRPALTQKSARHVSLFGIVSECSSCDAHSTSTLWRRVTPIASPTSTFASKRLCH